MGQVKKYNGESTLVTKDLPLALCSTPSDRLLHYVCGQRTIGSSGLDSLFYTMTVSKEKL